MPLPLIALLCSPLCSTISMCTFMAGQLSFYMLNQGIPSRLRLVAPSPPEVNSSPPAPIPLEIYDPISTNDWLKSYLLPKGTTVDYRKLKAAGWIRFAKIPLKLIKKYTLNEEKGPQALLKHIALLYNNFAGVCIYHTMMNQGSCGQDAYHCSGPMSGEHTNYYVHFR
ncbi:hypothetical protein BDP27DRAFT_1372456 [Rhodocollybia butyracea]|uniref:Uncharacterized protein n=1 Tax=Rhodocollybia butyracea TaxID=206335 RepID=A0A9P5P5B7_9AGAR|nr:hypothetical protein BDP27DRAFT_1372456 [Rhodocollybia butyracea]